jgi:Flp pilus assembly protein TadB
MKNRLPRSVIMRPAVERRGGRIKNADMHGDSRTIATSHRLIQGTAMTRPTDEHTRKHQRRSTLRRPEPIRWHQMTWKDYLRVGLGIVMFILGIAGLVLPILQGVLFLIISAILLAPYSRWVANKLDWFEARFPWVSDKARGLTQRWRRKFG